MTTFSNHLDHGGKFGVAVTKNFANCLGIEIASGYFGVPLLERIRSKLLTIAKRGHCKILIGMIYHEGVSLNQKETLEQLHFDLRQINSNSGVYIAREQYHGKIYKFTYSDNEKIWVGSSNFSDSGFYGNIEFNTEIIEHETKLQTSNFLNFMFSGSGDISAPLNEVELVIKGQRTGKVLTKRDGKKHLSDFKIKRKDYPTAVSTTSCEIELRVDSQPASSLNLYFDKGRKHDGKYMPRPWYEVEITSTIEERQKINYPIGDFTAYYQDDGNYYAIPMLTASAGHKAITTKGNREILGELIKGKLQRLGHLQIYERVTSEVLDDYGSRSIKLNKFDDGKYYFEF